MDKRLEAIRNLGSDKFTLEMFQEDTGRMVSIISTYISEGIAKELLSTYVSVYADKSQDVNNYIAKWEHRAKIFHKVIEHMQSEDFTKAMSMPNATKKEIYAEFLPVIQTMYDQKELANRKASVAKEWVKAYGILVGILEAECNEN